jgi:hypothetical protein
MTLIKRSNWQIAIGKAKVQLQIRFLPRMNTDFTDEFRFQKIKFKIRNIRVYPR